MKTETDEKTVTEDLTININVGNNKELVILGFDKSIAWLEMTPLVAIRVAVVMKEKAIGILRSEPT